MSFTKRRDAILRCGKDRDLVLIFNADLKVHYLRLSKGIPLNVFNAIVKYRNPYLVQDQHPEVNFYQILEWSEKIRERNQGEIPPSFISL